MHILICACPCAKYIRHVHFSTFNDTRHYACLRRRPWALRAMTARDTVGGAKNEPLKDTSGVNLHRLTKFGGVGEQKTDKQTNFSQIIL